MGSLFGREIDGVEADLSKESSELCMVELKINGADAELKVEVVFLPDEFRHSRLLALI